MTEPTTEERIGQAMLRDQHRLRRLLRSLDQRRRGKQPLDRERQRIDQSLAASIAQREQRLANRPELRYDDALPITAKREEIEQAVRQHPVVIVCGETGSGKSTQLPKICLAAGRGVAGFIGHTQPRRIAARTIAARLAEELGTSLGGHVGFKIRFSDTVQPHSYIKLMTDGILLAETQQDRFLEEYDTLIIDEAHERSLNIDFLLGYVKRLLPKRPELRLIITSATIDAARFAAHFGGEQPAPVIEVSGRSYPVETRYRPAEQDEEEADDAVLLAVKELCAEGPGDLLVFLPTEREIRDTAKRLRGWALRHGEKTAVLPLYARLSVAEQNRVFQPGKQRRIVLATNVAESSLTVPGIRYVVDTGTARISRYSTRSNVQRLPIEPISRASADQRQGRCGRVAPGICIRLYSEEDYLSRDQYTTPEIRRTNLASVILQMLALRLGSISEFPFLDPPRPDAIRDGYKTLFELHAIDAHYQLTDLGRQMSRLPVDPRIARMVLAAAQEGCLADVLIIAAELEVQDPRDRPAEKQQAADEAHARFSDESSDFLSLLKLWDFFHQLKADLSRSKLSKACQQNFLSHVRLREWQDVHRQLKELVEQFGLEVTARQNNYDAIHRALLAGLLSHVATLGDGHEYQAAGGSKAFLWPGSGLFQKKPKWVVAAEAVETSRRFLRTVARVDPAWIESLAEHLVKRSHYDPFWSQRQGTALIHEKVTLYGLPLSIGRRVKLGPIDARKAREIFIQSGLVEGQVRLDGTFYQHNRQLIEHLKSMGARARRAGYLVPEFVQVAFYDERLPQEVLDVASLRRWLNEASAAERDRLQMRAEDLLPIAADPLPDRSAYPDTLCAGPLKLDLNYRFQPGDQRDGLSVDVPLAACGQVDPQQLEWLVPGLLEEKLTQLIRTLPKSIRRALVPAPDSARKAAALLDFGRQAFLPAVAQALSQVAGETIPVQALDMSRLPEHLRVHVRVLDEGGNVVAQGRDWDELRRTLGHDDTASHGTITDEQWMRDNITRWDLELFPEELQVERGGLRLSAYPTLIDRGESVSLRLLNQPAVAARETRRGLRRLVCLAEHRELRSQVHWLPQIEQLQMFASTLRYQIDLRTQIAEMLAELAYVAKQPVPRDAEQFQLYLRIGRRELPAVVQDAAHLLVPLWENYHELRLKLDETRAPQLADAVADLEEQLQALLPEGFLAETSWLWLKHFPRYLAAMLHRLDKLLSGGAPRDAELRAQLRPLWKAYRERLAEHRQRGLFDPELETYRWMVEELRVSLFAQQLGTAAKISFPRLEKQWAKTTA